MCYWVGTKKVREELIRRFKDTDDEIAKLFYETFIVNNALDFQEHYVAMGKAKPTLTTLIKENHQLQFRNMLWTLNWSYTNYKTGATTTRELLNSTCEKVFFQHKDIIYQQRCLISIDGYYEYFHYNNQTYPFYIHPADGIFYAGGIWDKHLTETGQESFNFSIITTPPNPFTQKLHNNPEAPSGPRMLLLLPRENALTYLNDNLTQNELKKLFIPLPEAHMTAHPVMRFLRKEFAPYLNTPQVREPFNYPELVA